MKRVEEELVRAKYIDGKQQTGKCAKGDVDGKSTIEGSQKVIKESAVVSETLKLKT
jgi:hypothetical protein